MSSTSPATPFPAEALRLLPLDAPQLADEIVLGPDGVPLPDPRTPFVEQYVIRRLERAALDGFAATPTSTSVVDALLRVFGRMPAAGICMHLAHRFEDPAALALLRQRVDELRPQHDSPMIPEECWALFFSPASLVLDACLRTRSIATARAWRSQLPDDWGEWLALQVGHVLG
jgi:hypothetical protein